MKKGKVWIIDILCYTLGCIIYSAAVSIFITPNQITPGGITGISTVINYLTGIPSGITLFVINIPILIVGFIKLGGNLLLKTAIATSILSISLDISEKFLPSLYADKILVSIFGGIFAGLGISIVMARGATTGGVDIIAKLVNKRFRHFTVGRVILILDVVAIAFATIVYGEIQSALYSVISIYASSVVMDTVLYGGDRGKIIYIISNFADDISKEINTIAKRGVTQFNATGGYTGDERTMLMCTVRVQEVATILSIVNRKDKNAFVVVADAGEIIGEGFKSIDK